MRFPRAAAAIALAAGVALGTAGCTFLTPIATLNQYNPSDGVNTSVGAIDVRNMVGIINEDGSAINLLVTFNNTSADDITLSVQFDSGGQRTTETFTVPGSNALQLGVDDEQSILVLDPGVKAGDLLEVYVQYGDVPGKTILVPVLDGTLAEYEGLVRDKPKPTPTPEPTPTGTPAPTETPAPEEGESQG